MLSEITFLDERTRKKLERAGYGSETWTATYHKLKGFEPIVSDISQRVQFISGMVHPLAPFAGLGVDLISSFIKDKILQKKEEELSKLGLKKERGIAGFFSELFGKGKVRRRILETEERKIDLATEAAKSAVSIFLAGKALYDRAKQSQMMYPMYPYMGEIPTMTIGTFSVPQEQAHAVQQRLQQLATSSGHITPEQIQSLIGGSQIKTSSDITHAFASLFGIRQGSSSVDAVARTLQGFGASGTVHPGLVMTVRRAYAPYFREIGKGVTYEKAPGIIGWILRRTPIPKQMAEKKLAPAIAGVHSLLDSFEIMLRSANQQSFYDNLHYYAMEQRLRNSPLLGVQ